MTTAEASCWRCGRKLIEIESEPGRHIPPGVILKKKCERCNAINHLPLDKLLEAAIS